MWHWWRRRERDLERELSSHLELESEEHGGDPNAARRAIGNLARIKEETRATWGWPAAERCWQDFRYAARTLHRNPRFTLMAALVIALGVGPCVAIFSVFDQLLLRPLPFPDPDRIYQLTQLDLSPNRTRNGVTYSEEIPGGRKALETFRAENKVFEEIAGVWSRSVVLTGVAEPQQLTAELYSAGMFRVAGVPPLMGRGFAEAEDSPGGEPVAVIGEKLWRGVFLADPGILGKTAILDGVGYRIVGVMPAYFRGLSVRDVNNLWLPAFQKGDSPAIFVLYGRLKPGVEESTGRAQMELIASHVGTGIRMIPLPQALLYGYRTQMLLMFGFTALLLLIGCTNVANLLLARSTARSRELVVRAAIGASPLRLMRQSLLEASLVAALGAVGGMLLAVAVGPLITAGLTLPRPIPVVADPRMLGFAMLATLCTTLLCGLLPALEASRVDVSSGMKEGARSSTNRTSHRTRGLLLAMQVGLSLTLLAAAGTLVQSLLVVQPTNPGFATGERIVLPVYLGAKTYAQPEKRAAYARQAVERLARVSGVRAVAVTSYLPLSGFAGGISIDRTPGAPVVASLENVGPGYFSLMGMPVRQGREFTADDRAGTEAVAIVNEAFVQHFLDGQNAVGKTITTIGGREKHELRIVGVVTNVRSGVEPLTYRSYVYRPFEQAPTTMLSLVVNTPLPLDAAAPALRQAMLEVDPQQPIRKLESAQEVVNSMLVTIRGRTWLLSAAAGIALLLTFAGIYAVASYGVVQRTREIGVRTALGARRLDIWRLVVREGSLQVAAGLFIGSAGAWAVTRLLSTNLTEVYPISLDWFVGVASLLILISILATVFPVRRALGVDPTTALRQE